MAPATTELTILFADISGSTRLFETLGDESARRLVADCLQRLSEIAARYHGQVVKTIGDEVMCTFPDAEAATTAACEMHETLEDEAAERTGTLEPQVRVRIGLHHGPAIVEEADVFGDAVNVAARMTALSKAGQIITTESTVETLPPILRASTRFVDRAPVKGKKDTINIYEVIWQQDDVTRMSTAVIEGQQTMHARLRLRYRDQQIELGAERPAVVLGRSKGADITVSESLASRQHVRVEYRRGKFFIIDHSTNGTYIRRAGSDDAFVRREEAPLTGHGQLSLGRPFQEGPTDVVHFDTRP